MAGVGGYDVEVERTAAGRTLKKLFPRLVSNIPPEAICDMLYSQGVIGDDELERATDDQLASKKRTRFLIHALQKAVKSNHTLLNVFCECLEESEDVQLTRMATQVRERQREEIEAGLDDADGRAMKSESSRTEMLSTLKNELSVIQRRIYQSDDNLEAKYSILKECIEHHLKSSLENEARRAELEIVLKSLCYEERLVPTKLHDWCFAKLNELCNSWDEQTRASPRRTSGASSKEPAVPPLFCKEVCYHAALLCDVINQSDNKGYEKFLKKQSTGHYFEEISMSNPSTDDLVTEKYVIARHDKTLYIAFCGEPDLLGWKMKYTSFEEGLEKQASHIPIRFFVEQLRDSQRIVLTGFSFGALLAISMMANIWKNTYISEDILRKHIVCIAFGAPLINLPRVNQDQQEASKMESTIHLVFLKDDLIPRLLRFTNIESSFGAPFQQSAHLALPSGNSMVFQNSFASVCVEQLANLQDAHNETAVVPAQAADSLGHLKMLLRRAVLQVQAGSLLRPPLLGVFHLLYTNPSKGLLMQELTELAANDELNYLTAMGIEQLDEHLFKQHTMSEYRMKLFRGYLDRGPKKYSPPPQDRKEVQLVKILKPSVTSVRFHRHGDEVAVVLEGNSLWFCQKIQVGTGDNSKTVKSPLPNATQRSVQFNYSPKSKHDSIVQPSTEVVKVSLHSQFAKPIQNQAVKVTFNEGYAISVRQSQLAKLTPSQVITLSYLSSMLELPPTEQPSTPSKRFRCIAEFLENAIRIVPVESICHAITYGNTQCAMKCANVLLNAEKKIPSSLSLASGYRSAFVRLTTGLTPEREKELHRQLARNLPPVLFAQPILAPSVPVQASGTGHQTSHKKKPKKRLTKPYSEVVSSGSRGAQPLSAQPPLPQPPMVGFGVTVQVGAPPVSLPAEEGENYQWIIKGLQRRTSELQDSYPELFRSDKIISGRNIDEFYPAMRQESRTSRRSYFLPSPTEVLRLAQADLRQLRSQASCQYERVQNHSSSGSSSSLSDEESVSSSDLNMRMLTKVMDIWKNDLTICASLLGAFMEQQISVPLVNSPQETAKAVSFTEADPAVGVWALFSLQLIDLEQMFKSFGEQNLFILIGNYIEGIFSNVEGTSQPDNDRRYAGKVQFLLQGCMPTVSCNTQYISYSLEQQLNQLCSGYGIKPGTRVDNLVNNWDDCFKKSLLYHVKPAYRPLLARWITWSLNIHQLREGLAAYSTIGIIGLVNSGKSCLLRQLFKKKVLVGTTEIQRTTIPFMYNLDDIVDGLSVIDFPGVDDRDESIAGLARLLLTLAQLVILVVDYRKIHTTSAKDWLDLLDKESVPYLVCLTYADKLYANEMLDRKCPEHITKRKIGRELETIEEKLGRSPNRTMNFYSFSQDRDSSLNSKEGRQELLTAGILSTKEVGKWIEERLRDYLHQDDVANRLLQFLNQ